MIVIRINVLLRPEDIKQVAEFIMKQAETRVIALPYCCEVLKEDSADDDIAILLQDGEPYLCTGCEFVRKQAELTNCHGNPGQFKKLVCPYHRTKMGDAIFHSYFDLDGMIICPNWPPKEGAR